MTQTLFSPDSNQFLSSLYIAARDPHLSGTYQCSATYNGISARAQILIIIEGNVLWAIKWSYNHVYILETLELKYSELKDFTDTNYKIAVAEKLLLEGSVDSRQIAEELGKKFARVITF